MAAEFLLQSDLSYDPTAKIALCVVYYDSIDDVLNRYEMTTEWFDISERYQNGNHGTLTTIGNNVSKFGNVYVYLVHEKQAYRYKFTNCNYDKKYSIKITKGENKPIMKINGGSAYRRDEVPAQGCWTYFVGCGSVISALDQEEPHDDCVIL